MTTPRRMRGQSAAIALLLRILRLVARMSVTTVIGGTVTILWLAGLTFNFNSVGPGKYVEIGDPRGDRLALTISISSRPPSNNSSRIAHLTQCLELPTPQVVGRSWKACGTIPGYQRLCESADWITLDGLLTPPPQVPVWEPPHDLNPLFKDLAKFILKPFTQITPRDLQQVMDEPKCEEAVKFKIDEGALWVVVPDTSKFDHDKRVFMGLRRLHPLKNIQLLLDQGYKFPYMEGVLCEGDEPPVGPGFTLAYNTQWQPGESTGIPMPLMEFSTPLETWNDKLDQAFTWRSKYEWGQRKKEAVFRGDLRTCYPTMGDELARPVDYSVPCGRVGLYFVASKCGGVNIALDTNPMPMSKQEQFKFILYVEGHFGWANRMGLLMAMQNVVIRQFNAPYEEWYTAFLEPYVHYVPVDHLFNYLPGILQWCQENDDAVQQISRNADIFARTFLPTETQMQFVVTLIREYAKRFQRNESMLDDWIQLEKLDTFSYYLMFGTGPRSNAKSSTQVFTPWTKGVTKERMQPQKKTREN